MTKNAQSRIGISRVASFTLIIMLLIYAPFRMAHAQGGRQAVAPPANDNFANASGFSLGLGDVSGTTVDATKQLFEPDHGGNPGGKSVWYFFGVTGDNIGFCLKVRATSLGFNTLLAVYTGSGFLSLTQRGSNDDYGRSTNSKVCFPLDAGFTTYYVAVDGYNGDSGTFTIPNFATTTNLLYVKSSRFNGTGNNAVTVFRPTNGTWYTNSANGFQAFQWGQSGDIPVPADYDGDSVTDYAVFRPSNGFWYVSQSATGTFRGVAFGQNGDKPVHGDYNGDGLDDFAVFRPSNGTWYILDSKTGAFSYAQFGQNGDKPVADYYDGDAKMDIAVFRPGNATWYILNSYTNAVTSQQWGASGDVPVPGDYGSLDGKADITVWRPSNGAWYSLDSLNNQLIVKQFGQNGDIPQPVTRLGVDDTTFSYCVFRPSNGTWYTLTPSGQFQAIQFGTNGDVPASTFYVVQP